jgi:hypothetical protein
MMDCARIIGMQTIHFLYSSVYVVDIAVPFLSSFKMYRPVSRRLVKGMVLD